MQQQSQAGGPGSIGLRRLLRASAFNCGALTTDAASTEQKDQKDDKKALCVAFWSRLECCAAFTPRYSTKAPNPNRNSIGRSLLPRTPLQPERTACPYSP